MATSKNYKRYASGGNSKNRRLDDGLRAMQVQNDRQVQALERLEVQNRIQSQAFTSGLEKKAAKEAKNRELLNKLEVQKPRQMREKSIKQNADVKIKSLEREAVENDKLSKVWAGLSPTLAKNAQDLFASTEKYLGKTEAIEVFNDRLEDGTYSKTMQLFDAMKAEGKDLDSQQARYNLYADGKKFEGDYLTQVGKHRNRYLKDIEFEELKKNFDGLETDLVAFLKENGLYNTKDILSHYQYRALEYLEQYGINPDSEMGFKVQRLFRSKGAVAENQMMLGEDYELHSGVVDSALKELESKQEPNAGDYVGNEAGYANALLASNLDKNAIWVKAVTSQNQLPLKGKNGAYSINQAPNMRNSIETFLKNALQNTHYSDSLGTESGWERYKEDILGVTENNQYGYVIPGGNPTKKTDRILAKFPFLEAQMKEEWFDQNKKTIEAIKATKDEELKAIGNQIQARIKKKEFVGQMDYEGEFWKVWESNKGNKYVNQIMGARIGLSGENINFNDAIVQSIRDGSIEEIMNAWAMMDENGGSAKDQRTAFAVKNLQGLANYFNVNVEALDNIIEGQSKALLTEALKHDVIGTNKTLSQEGIDRKITATLLAKYLTAQGDNPKEKYANALAEVQAMMGYKDGKMSNFENSVRGYGPFRQKEVGTKIIFTNSAAAGKSYSGITSMEIEDMLGTTHNTIFDADKEENLTRVERLSHIVQYSMRQDGVTMQDLYSFLVDGKTDNALINHLVTDRLGKNISLSEFKRSLEPILDAGAYNQVVMMDGDEWCNYKFGPGSSNLSQKDKPTAICVQTIKKQFGVNPWEVLVDDKVREKLNNMLQERN